MNGANRAGIVIGILAGSAVGGAVTHLVWCRETPAATSAPAPVDVDRFRLRSADGTTVAELAAPGKGGAVLNLLSAEGDLRLQLGTYDGSVSRSEKGLPLVGLSDNGRRLRLLLRLAGKNESPVLVFKDTRGADRMVIGLGLAEESEEPFIATFDRNGKKQLLTGQY